MGKICETKIKGNTHNMRSTFFSSKNNTVCSGNKTPHPEHINLFNSSKVDLTDRDFDGYFPNALIEYLQKSETLDTLILTQNKINEYSIVDLAKILEKNISLTHLNLSSNQIGNEGAKTLLDAIGKNANSSLSKLDLSNNNIDSIATDTIKYFMKTNKSLRTLILDDNALNTLADNNLTLSNLFESLSENQTLQYISLKNTLLRSEDIKSLICGLNNNKALCEIDLSHSTTGVSADIIITLINLLKVREPKCILKLGKLSSESFDRVQSVCEDNEELIQFDLPPKISLSKRSFM